MVGVGKERVVVVVVVVGILNCRQGKKVTFFDSFLFFVFLCSVSAIFVP